MGLVRSPAAQVVLLCGIAGSGKTTYAQSLEAQGYVRLSVDDGLEQRLVELVREGRRVVVDRSLWQRSYRNHTKQLVESAGGGWELVYLKVPPDVLRARRQERSRRFDANSAFPITADILDHYLEVFEEPAGEGETVVETPAMVRCVGAIVRDEARRLLLIQRGQSPAQGTWSLPGGRVEAGESDAQAVARELQEETGLVGQPGELVGRVERDGPAGVTYEIFDYAATVVGGRLRAGTDAADARWVDEAELVDLPCAPGLVDTLRDWGQLDGR